MTSLPKLPAKDFIAFELIDPQPEPIRTGYIRRMLHNGGHAAGGLLEGNAAAAPFARKVVKELAELNQAYLLPPEDPTRRPKMASEISDVRDVLARLATDFPRKVQAARPREVTLTEATENWQRLALQLMETGLTSGRIKYLNACIGSTRQALNAFIRQPDVALTLRELNEAANRRTSGIDDFEDWYVTHFVVPRRLTDVINAFRPDKWREVPLMDIDKGALITQGMLNEGRHGTMKSQKPVYVRPRLPESKPSEHERNPLAKRRRVSPFLLPSEWPGD